MGECFLTAHLWLVESGRAGGCGIPPIREGRGWMGHGPPAKGFCAHLRGGQWPSATCGRTGSLRRGDLAAVGRAIPGLRIESGGTRHLRWGQLLAIRSHGLLRPPAVGPTAFGGESWLRGFVLSPVSESRPGAPATCGGANCSLSARKGFCAHLRGGQWPSAGRTGRGGSCYPRSQNRVRGHPRWG